MLENAKSGHQAAIEGISQLQAQMTFRFSVLSKLLDQQMSAIAGQVGLSLTGYRVLATVSAFGEVTAADLARYTGYDKAAVSRQVTDLIQNGLITSTSDPHHGRRKLLRMTADGDAALRNAAPLVEARREGLSAQLTNDEERIFLSVIEKLASHVSNDLLARGRNAA